MWYIFDDKCYECNYDIDRDMLNMVIKYDDIIKPIKTYKYLNKEDEKYNDDGSIEFKRIFSSNKHLNKLYKVYIACKTHSYQTGTYLFKVIIEETGEEVRLIYSKKNGYKMPVFPEKPINQYLNYYCREYIYETISRLEWRLAVTGKSISLVNKEYNIVFE